MPRVSIGLPVYNGEPFVSEAIESTLLQTFEDFELIISDNASTDRTEEICRTYAAKDRRIRYCRSQDNLGAGKNFNRAFELSSGEYFKWAAHDDVLAPDFLFKCVEVLDQNPTVVLAYPGTIEIDDVGTAVRSHDLQASIDADKPYERLKAFLRNSHHRCFEIFGLIRASSLTLTSRMGNYAGADIVLLGELKLFGPCYQIPEYLFFRRGHLGLFQHDKLPVRHLRTAWFDPVKEGRLIFPAWKRLLCHWRSIRRAPLRWDERALCYLEVLRLARYRWRTLVEDLNIAIKQARRPEATPTSIGPRT